MVKHLILAHLLSRLYCSKCLDDAKRNFKSFLMNIQQTDKFKESTLLRIRLKVLKSLIGSY